MQMNSWKTFQTTLNKCMFNVRCSFSGPLTKRFVRIQNVLQKYYFFKSVFLVFFNNNSITATSTEQIVSMMVAYLVLNICLIEYGVAGIFSEKDRSWIHLNWTKEDYPISNLCILKFFAGSSFF